MTRTAIDLVTHHGYFMCGDAAVDPLAALEAMAEMPWEGCLRPNPSWVLFAVEQEDTLLEVDLADAEPAVAEDAAAAARASVAVADGRLLIFGEGPDVDAQEVSCPAGRVGLLFQWDLHRSWLTVWPTEDELVPERLHRDEARIHRLAQDAAALQADKEPIEAARQASLRGDIDGPKRVLVRLADRGEPLAISLLVQLHAHLGEFDAVIDRGLPLLVGEVEVVGPLVNFFSNDLGPLVRRAAESTGRTAEILDAARTALVRSDLHPWLRNQLEHIFLPWPNADLALRTEQDRFIAINIMHQIDGSGRLLARSVWDPELQTIYVRGRDQIAAGKPDHAWEAFRARVPGWTAVRWELAPLGIIWDPVLRDLWTPERGREILRTPRSTEFL